MTSRCARVLAGGFVALLTAAAVSPASAAVDPGPTELVSRSEQGVPADSDSWDPQVSADGQFVAFTSEASSLVAGDTNGARDVFVADRADGSVERVSLGEHDRQLAGDSELASISADGRYVLFHAAEPVPTGDGTRLDGGSYLRDRVEGTTRRIEPLVREGTPVPVGGTMSGNGRFTLFTSDVALVAADHNDALDLYRRDLVTGGLRLVSTGLTTDDFRQTRWPAISHSGRFVAFDFTARLVERDRLRSWDIYVRDLTKPRPRLVTLRSDGVQANRGSMAPAISAGGRYVVFSSYATNLVRGDTNDEWDVFWHDRRTATTERVSVNSRGRQGDRQSQGPGFWSESASVSRDGRFVVFGSFATNLDHATDDDVARNVFVRDRATGTTRALSLAPDGTGADDDSGGGIVSAEGVATAFWSAAENLVASDANGVEDVFVRRLGS